MQRLNFERLQNLYKETTLTNLKILQGIQEQNSVMQTLVEVERKRAPTGYLASQLLSVMDSPPKRSRQEDGLE